LYTIKNVDMHVNHKLTNQPQTWTFEYVCVC